MKKGNRVKFDHMGEEHSGIITEIASISIGSELHDIVMVKSDRHVLQLAVNITLFPGRVRKDESR
jgi:hypothetical protein|tara:strand:+ start:2534 stop:2728 length:195 start_codon:yes stop_codon:yes gene_type:complete